MKNYQIHYLVGKNCQTEEVTKSPFTFLEKQFSLSIPLITGVCIKKRQKKKEEVHNIYVGRELSISDFQKNPVLYEKYNITLEDLADFAVQGYDKVCVLNYKKYDTALVGLSSKDYVVPDYFALKKALFLVMSQNFS